MSRKRAGVAVCDYCIIFRNYSHIDYIYILIACICLNLLSMSYRIIFFYLITSDFYVTFLVQYLRLKDNLYDATNKLLF